MPSVTGEDHLDVAKTRARAYFAAQAVAGALWWVAVFASDEVRSGTLGDWSPHLLVGPDLVLFVGASGMAAAFGHPAAAAVAATWTTGLTATLVVYGLVERQAGWGVVLMVLATVGTLAATLTMWFGRLPVRWFFVGPFAFRVAVDRSPRQHLRHSLSQLVVFWTGFFVAVPLLLMSIEARLRLEWSSLHHPGWTVVGAVTFALASGLGLWACVSMALRGAGTPLPSAMARNLVVVGPYRFVRNPMALAGAVQTIAVGLWLGAWTVIAVAVTGALIWNTFIRPEEEADLAVRFGEDFDRYRAAIRCWLPAGRGFERFR